MYSLHTQEPKVSVVINNLENPIYKEEKINCTSELTCQMLTNLIQHAANSVRNRIYSDIKKKFKGLSKQFYTFLINIVFVFPFELVVNQFNHISACSVPCNCLTFNTQTRSLEEEARVTNCIAGFLYHLRICFVFLLAYH